MYIPSPPPLVLENGGWERAAPQANHFHLQIVESYTTEKRQVASVKLIIEITHYCIYVAVSTSHDM